MSIIIDKIDRECYKPFAQTQCLAGGKMSTKQTGNTRSNVMYAIVTYLEKTSPKAARAKELIDLCAEIIGKTSTHMIIKEMVAAKQLLRTEAGNQVTYQLNPEFRPKVVTKEKENAAKHKILETFKKSPGTTFKRIDLINICKDICGATTTERAIAALVATKDLLRFGKKKHDLRYNSKKAQPTQATPSAQNTSTKDDNPVNTLGQTSPNETNFALPLDILESESKKLQKMIKEDADQKSEIEEKIKLLNEDLKIVTSRYKNREEQLSAIQSAVTLLNEKQQQNLKTPTTQNKKPTNQPLLNGSTNHPQTPPSLTN